MDFLRLSYHGVRGFFDKPPDIEKLNLSESPCKDGQVLFLGDSLLYITIKAYDLLPKIKSFLKLNYDLDYINLSRNGSTIQDIRKGFETILVHLEQLPEEKRTNIFVIMFWDSDITSLSASAYNGSKKDVQHKYTNNLVFILNKCRDLGIKVNVMGPGLLESPDKKGFVEDICNLNKFICSKHGADYGNIRRIFLDTEIGPSPESSSPKKKLTVDGEHLNEEGAVVAAQVFAAAIDKWKEVNVPEGNQISWNPLNVEKAKITPKNENTSLRSSFFDRNSILDKMMPEKKSSKLLPSNSLSNSSDKELDARSSLSEKPAITRI